MKTAGNTVTETDPHGAGRDFAPRLDDATNCELPAGSLLRCQTWPKLVDPLVAGSHHVSRLPSREADRRIGLVQRLDPVDEGGEGFLRGGSRGSVCGWLQCSDSRCLGLSMV